MTAHTTFGSPDAGGSERGTITGEGIQEVLDALNDDICREILRTIDGEPLTATEIADDCDLPQSTAYRKLDLLATTPLVREGTRIRDNGKHASEYGRTVEDVIVRIGEDGFELTIVD